MVSKKDLLDYLAGRRDSMVCEVADYFEISEAAAGMALLRLQRQGLVNRAVESADQAFYYSLSDRGADRREYLARCARARIDA